MAMKGKWGIPIYYFTIVIIIGSQPASCQEKPTTSTTFMTPKPVDFFEYDDSEEKLDPQDYVWYSKNEQGFYYVDHEAGEYFRLSSGKFIKFNHTFTLVGNDTYVKDPNGNYKKDSLGNYYFVNFTTVATTRRTFKTTTTPMTFTRPPPPPEVFQNFYMKDIFDSLPPIELINCTHCPRVYIPVCGSDGRSYTNVCKMNCMNIKKTRFRKVSIKYMGICQEYNEPYEY